MVTVWADEAPTEARGARALSWGDWSLARWLLYWTELRERARYRNVPNERVAVRTHVAPDPVGQLPLRAVDGPALCAWLARLVQTRARAPYHASPAGVRYGGAALSLSTVRGIVCLVRTGLEEARRRGVLQTNPARELCLPRTLAATTRAPLDAVLEPTEQTALLASMRDRISTRRRATDRRDAYAAWLMVRVALSTGLRRGELLALRWVDVALGGDEPHLVVRFGGGAGRATKGGRPRRLPLFGDAIAALSEWRVSRAVEKGEAIVFPAPGGGMRRVAPTPALRDALARAGISKRCRWHDLRHTCATSLLEGWWGRAWSVSEVQQLLGHASARMTERYCHERGHLLFRAAREHRVSTGLSGTPREPLATSRTVSVGLEKSEAPNGDVRRAIGTTYRSVVPTTETSSGERFGEGATPMVDSSVQQQLREQLIECAETGERVCLHYRRNGVPCVRAGRIASLTHEGLVFVGEGAPLRLENIERVTRTRAASSAPVKDGAS